LDAEMKTRTEALRETGVLPFFIPKGALTHHLRSRRWYPSFVRLVRSARRMRLLRQPPDNATSPAGTAVIVCGAQNGLGQNDPHHFGTLRKPATGSFIAVMDGACCPSIFFFGKETKTRVRKGANDSFSPL
jgi:hypothetical protein